MATTPLRWLYDELPRLIAGGVIDDDAAARIRSHYGPLDETPVSHRLLLVFGVLGALLIGAGLVLLLAHNWEQLPPPVRAAVAFGVLLLGQGLVGWTVLRRSASTAWTEGSAAFLTLAIGLTVALIGQTYQIGGDLESLLVTVIPLALPVVYLLRSRVSAALIAVGIATWAHSGNSWHPISWSRLGIFAAMVVALAPFVGYVLRHDGRSSRSVLMGWVAAGSLVVTFIRLAEDGGGLWLALFTSLLAAFYAAGSHLGEGSVEPWSAWRQPLHVLGLLGVGIMLLIGGFREVWQDVDPVFEDGLYGVGVLGFLLAVYAVGGAWRLGRAGRWPQLLLAAAPLLMFLGYSLGSQGQAATLTAVAVNVYALATGLWFCIQGLRAGRLGTANAGLMLVVGMFALRFLDTDWSFVARGSAFIALGVCFLAVNVWLLRQRQEVRS